MRALLVLTLAAVIFLGAGCVKQEGPRSADPSPIPVPAGYIPTPLASSTQTNPTGWTVQRFGDVWSLAHPGIVLPTNEVPAEKTRTRLFTVDLGTAVADAGEKSVPRRTLVIDQLRPGDEYLSQGCVASSTVLGADRSAVSTTTARGIGVCVRAQTEGAAGNRYATLSASLMGVQSAYLVEYVVHSVECANYERPAEQCVAYEQARDAALFWRILETLDYVRR